jgi:hypothetical protein
MNPGSHGPWNEWQLYLLRWKNNELAGDNVDYFIFCLRWVFGLYFRKAIAEPLGS